MKFSEKIEWNPKVCNGKPVIKGTRIPLGIILEQIAEGASWDQVLRDYPELKREDIQAALFFASANIEHSDIREVHS
jgi:uncharacterized protein (DUF433 family)